MKDYTEHYPLREMKVFWGATDDISSCKVLQVQGFACGNDMWWCPELGYSASSKYNLFKTQGEALNHAITDVSKRIEQLEKSRSRLESDLQLLQEGASS